MQYFPEVMYFVLAGMVWCIYTADRLIDTQCRDREAWSMRHYVHNRYRWGFVGGWFVVFILTVGAALSEFRWGLLWYVVPALVACLGYFSLAMAAFGKAQVSYGKNIIAGMTFAYGTALGAHFYLPSLGVIELLLSPLFLGLGVVCILNMMSIDLWEAVARGNEEELFAEVSLTPALGLLGLFSLINFWDAEKIQESFSERVAESYYMDEFFMALLISAAGLLVLNRFRDRFSIEALRVWGDLVLLLPVPLFLVV